MLPDPGHQSGQEDRQPQPNAENRQPVPPDDDEDEDILDHGVAGGEEEPHQEELPGGEPFLLRHADDDPRPVGDAQKNPGEQGDRRVPREPHAPHHRLHDVPRPAEDGEVPQHFEERHQRDDDEDELGGKLQAPQEGGKENFHHESPGSAIAQEEAVSQRLQSPRSSRPAAQAMTSRHRVRTPPRAPVVESTPPSTTRLWATPIIRPHCVTWKGVRCSGTITAMAAYRFRRNAATKAKAASPGRPKIPITGAKIFPSRSSTGVPFSSVTAT